MNLRPYQRQTIDNVKKDWAVGNRNVLTTIATGGGKTIVFLGLLAEELDQYPDRRCIIIAHRKELIDQPIERLAKFWPELARRSGIVMANQNDCDKKIIVATIQTLNGNGRLDEILKYGQVDYVVTDEAHHSTANSYIRVFDRLRAANPELKHLGVTATPLRADDVGLCKVYEKESAHYGIKELVGLGYLAPPRWLAIQTGVSLSGVGRSGSGEDKDFNQTQLSNVFETDNCFDLVVESHRKYATDRPSICFTVSVDGAYSLAEKFRSAGINAAAADGKTRKDTRQGIINDFRSGKLNVLCNVGLWTEGLDLPELSCVHMVRPTQSDGLYTQCIGRVLRIMPGKDDALILDYLPKEYRNIAMLGDVLGVDVPKENYVDEVPEGEVAAGFLFNGGQTIWKNGDPMQIISRQLDYLNLSPWQWIKPDRQGWAVIGLGQDKGDSIERILAISPPNEKMQLWGVWKGEQDRWMKSAIICSGTFEDVSSTANDYISRYGNASLAGKKRGWRIQPPSDGQVKFAKNLRVWNDGMSKGEVADAITYRLAIQSIARQGGVQ